MEEKMNIIIDTSGSMGENGKKAILAYTYNTIKNILKDRKYDNSMIIITNWADEDTKIKKLPKFEFNNTLTTLELKEYLKSENKPKSVLFISDGNVRLKEIIKSKDTKEIRYFFIKIGIDADISNLKRLVSKNNIYEVYDITTAFDKAYSFCINY